MPRNKYIVGSLLVVMWGMAVPAVTVAGTVTYGWSGTVETRLGSEDPWNLGEVPAPFYVEVTVPLNASDLAYNGDGQLLVDRAFFNEGVFARLWVEGEPLEFVSTPSDPFSTTVDFGEYSFGNIMSMQAAFRRGGVAAIFDTDVVVPTESFTFVLPAETPPVFPSTTSSGRSESNSGTYRTITVPGTLVSVVPEPASMSLAGLGLLATGLFRRRCGSW